MAVGVIKRFVHKRGGGLLSRGRRPYIPIYDGKLATLFLIDKPTQEDESPIKCHILNWGDDRLGCR